MPPKARAQEQGHDATAYLFPLHTNMQYLSPSATCPGANTHNVNVTTRICDSYELSVVREAEGVDGIAIPKVVRIRCKQVS